jgi:hypothetical protein
LLTEETLDVFFSVPGSKVHLSAIAGGFFTGPWDIDLEDKKFDQSRVHFTARSIPKVETTQAIIVAVGHNEGLAVDLTFAAPSGEPYERNLLSRDACRNIVFILKLRL